MKNKHFTRSTMFFTLNFNYTGEFASLCLFQPFLTLSNIKKNMFIQSNKTYLLYYAVVAIYLFK